MVRRRETRPMNPSPDIGFFGANVGAMAGRSAVDLAQLAESLGYKSMWTAEHPVLPRPRQAKPPLDPDWPIADPLIALGHLAAVTTTIELCTGVLVLPLHHPVRLAKQCATLDVLSGGRFVLGIGVGHLAIEFEALGTPMLRRGHRSDEYLSAMRVLWSHEPAGFAGGFTSFAGVDAYPKPTRPGGPQVVVGGESDAALRRAARLADGWYGFGQDPATARKMIDRLAKLRRDADRDRGPFRVSITPRQRLTPALFDDYAAAGVDQIVISVESDTHAGVMKRLEKNAP